VLDVKAFDEFLMVKCFKHETYKRLKGGGGGGVMPIPKPDNTAQTNESIPFLFFQNYAIPWTT
jgi:hypothetical protein